MPLTATGERIKAKFREEYGNEEGERIFYASIKAGTLKDCEMADAAEKTTRAAGILFITKENRVLYLKRGPGGDYPGYWCFPGGHTEDGETALGTAKREATEELGFLPDGMQVEWTTKNMQVAAPSAPLPVATAAPEQSPPPSAQPSTIQTVTFTTFLQRVKEEFAPKINGEHVGWAWAPATEPPEPLHPGCQIALARLSMNELDIARAMAAGELTSPQRYENITMFAIRITGTGLSYRRKLEEYVWREPSIYLNDEFLARCMGKPVIMEHPKKSATLNSKEFGDRVVGTIVLPYIKGDEVWGIANIYDDAAAEMMSQRDKDGNALSTSPAVVFRPMPGEKLNTKLELESGETMLIEGEPSLFDHVAICPLGVWDKGGPPAGVQLDAQVTGLDDGKLSAALQLSKLIEIDCALSRI